MDANWSPLWLGLRAAALSTAIALALGPWLAFLISRRPSLPALAGLPLSIATPLMAAYALLAPQFGWAVAALVALVFSLPHLVRASAVAFQQLPPEYLDAARGLGASEWRVFQRVAAPLVLGPVLGGAAFAFACVATDYVALLILARALRTPSPVAWPPLAMALTIGLAVHYLGLRWDSRRMA